MWGGHRWPHAPRSFFRWSARQGGTGTRTWGHRMPEQAAAPVKKGPCHRRHRRGSRLHEVGLLIGSGDVRVMLPGPLRIVLDPPSHARGA